MNGRMQPVCSNLDVAPLCPQSFCPLGTPSVAAAQIENSANDKAEGNENTEYSGGT